MEEKTGYIYVLTNESFHKSNWVKIGYADNVERRVSELSNTSVPLPFKVYAYYEIPKIEGTMPDKKLHDLIQTLNPSLRISDNREFFEIEPWDAYELLKSMAIIHNRLDKLHRNEENNYGSNELSEEVKEFTVDMLYPENTHVRNLYEKLKNAILDIGPELVIKTNKNYVTFRFDNNRKKGGNVVSLWPKSNCIEVVLNLKLGQLNDPNNITYDISNRLWTAAQYAFKYDESDDMEEVKNLIKQSYDLNK